MLMFYHPFHLVSLSPWPLLCSLGLMNFMLGMLMWINMLNMKLLFLGLFILLMVLFQWWRDLTRESTFQGFHSMKVINGLKFGMLLFIISELMFFVSFFWSYFHMFLSPSVEIGMFWVPLMIIKFNPLSIPLLNTLILLSSGMFITWSHFSLISSNYFVSILTLLLTIILGMLFTFFQYKEYNEAFYSIYDSVYGSIFYMLTGFHGIHVVIGTLFMMVMLLRMMFFQFSMYHHIGFEFCSWYWHFVDVVWLFLYIFLYWLSN